MNRTSHFLSCLSESEKLVASTIQYINENCSNWIASKNEAKPSKDNKHPSDMFLKQGDEVIEVELKRDAKSRATKNVFFEQTALQEAIQCGSNVLWFWIDEIKGFICFDMKSLYKELMNQHAYTRYIVNAGDGRNYNTTKLNPGWVVPVKILTGVNIVGDEGFEIRNTIIKADHIYKINRSPIDRKISEAFVKEYLTSQDSSYSHITSTGRQTTSMKWN